MPFLLHFFLDSRLKDGYTSSNAYYGGYSHGEEASCSAHCVLIVTAKRLGTWVIQDLWGAYSRGSFCRCMNIIDFVMGREKK